MTFPDPLLRYTLRCGVSLAAVFDRTVNGNIRPITYPDRAQAEALATKLGGRWRVLLPQTSGPFYLTDDPIPESAAL